MRAKIFSLAMLIMLALAMSFGLSSSQNISAQTCTDVVCATGSDSSPGVLFEELTAELDSGIKILDNTETVGIEFNPQAVADGTTWGGGSDFTWTMNGSGSPSPEKDPKFEFHDYRTKHIGQWEVVAEIDENKTTFASITSAASADLQQGEVVNQLIGHLIKSPTVQGDGHVDGACGLYIEPVSAPNKIDYPFGIYQAGTDDYNFMAGRLTIGEDAAGYLPTNMIVYLDKHYGSEETEIDTNYGAYFEVTQGSSLYVTSQNRFPATLECRYIYDTEDPTPWPPPLPEGWDIRTKVIDGRFLINNFGRINYAAGVTAGVDVIPEYPFPVPEPVYPGADVAVGVRGGITLGANIPVPEYEDPEDWDLDKANIKTAAGITTILNVDGGQINRLACFLAHVPDISNGQIGELAGIGIQPLTPKYATDAVIWRKYGIRQEGSEENLLNGYMTIDSKIGHDYHYDYDNDIYTDEPLILENFINIGAKSIFKLSFDDVDITNNLIGFKYSTPLIETTNYDLSVANSYCIYLETSKIDGVENSWGIYQEGNDPNLWHGHHKTDTEIYESVGSRYNYDAGSSIYWSNEPIEIEKLVGYNYETPDFHPTNGASCEITNAYGVYINPVKDQVTSSFITNSWGIYQEGNDPNHFGGDIETNGNLNVSGDADIAGKVTIAGTEKIRAYRATSAQTFAMPGWNKVWLNDESYDNLSHFDSESQYPTYQFTASMDGYYQVNATVCFAGTTNSNQIGIAIYKGGSAYALNYGDGFSGNLISLSISDIIPLNTDETISLWVYIISTGISVMHSPTGNNTYLSIHKIS